jgi:hypothetical protein
MIGDTYFIVNKTRNQGIEDRLQVAVIEHGSGEGSFNLWQLPAHRPLTLRPLFSVLLGLISNSVENRSIFRD